MMLLLLMPIVGSDGVSVCCAVLQSRRLVSHLEKAGVRFVFTSHQTYKRTKNIAGKLGLETDWNCAISLSEPSRRQQHRDQRRQHDTDGAFDGNNYDDDDHFGEGVISEFAMRKKFLNKVWPAL